MKAASGDIDCGGAKKVWLAIEGLSLEILCVRERTSRGELMLLVGRDSTAEPVMAKAGFLSDVAVKDIVLFFSSSLSLLLGAAIV
jgi:hypothetical protein